MSRTIDLFLEMLDISKRLSPSKAKDLFKALDKGMKREPRSRLIRVFTRGDKDYILEIDTGCCTDTKQKLILAYVSPTCKGRWVFHMGVNMGTYKRFGSYRRRSLLNKKGKIRLIWDQVCILPKPHGLANDTWDKDLRNPKSPLAKRMSKIIKLGSKIPVLGTPGTWGSYKPNQSWTGFSRSRVIKDR